MFSEAISLANSYATYIRACSPIWKRSYRRGQDNSLASSAASKWPMWKVQAPQKTPCWHRPLPPWCTGNRPLWHTGASRDQDTWSSRLPAQRDRIRCRVFHLSAVRRRSGHCRHFLLGEEHSIKRYLNSYSMLPGKDRRTAEWYTGGG